MTYRSSLPRLLFLLVMWMIITACACALILLGEPPANRETPRRTRPPVWGIPSS